MNKYVLVLAIFLTSCTTSTYLRGHKGTDIERIKIGTSQNEVEQIAGLRVKTMILNNGYHIDYYRYSKKLERNLSKAIINAALSYASAGSWEVFGMEIERKAKKEDQLIAIVYDKHNLVVDMTQHEPMHDDEI